MLILRRTELYNDATLTLYTDYNRWRDTRLQFVTVTGRDFVVYVYPDDAKTSLGQTRSALRVGRLVAETIDALLVAPLRPRYNPHDPLFRDIYRHVAVGPGDLEPFSYVRRARRKNRPGYGTDSVLSLRVEPRQRHSDATKRGWALANMLVTVLNARLIDQPRISSRRTRSAGQS